MCAIAYSRPVAWRVFARSDIGSCILVYAASRNSARALGLSTEYFGDAEYMDMYAIREPLADQFWTPDIERIVEGTTALEQGILRTIGWYYVEHQGEQCEECGLYHWPLVKNSELIISNLDERRICRMCAATLKMIKS